MGEIFDGVVQKEAPAQLDIHSAVLEEIQNGFQIIELFGDVLGEDDNVIEENQTDLN